jgi:outer membrane autotransporter protein
MDSTIVPQSAELVQNVPVIANTSLNNILGNEPVNFSSYGASAGSAPYSWSVTASVTGHWGSGDGEGLDPGYDIKNYLGQLAFYHRFDALRIGAAISVGRTEVDWDNLAETDSSDVSGTVFVRYDGPSYFVSLAGFLGRSQIDSTRHPGLGLTAEADYTVDFSGVSVRAGKLFEANSWHITPTLSLTYTEVRFPGHIERGAGTLNQISKPATKDSFEIEGGVRFSTDVDLGGKIFTPHLNLAIAYEAQDERLELETSFVNQPGVPGFITQSPDSGKVKGIVELGGSLALTDNVDLFLDYRGAFRKRDRIHSGTFGLTVSW